MSLLDPGSLEIIGTVLSDGETLLSGKPVTVNIPSESVKVGKITITTPATEIQVTYTP